MNFALLLMLVWQTRKFNAYLLKHGAGALLIVFQICYCHSEPLKCLHIRCKSFCLKYINCSDKTLRVLEAWSE